MKFLYIEDMFLSFQIYLTTHNLDLHTRGYAFITIDCSESYFCKNSAETELYSRKF